MVRELNEILTDKGMKMLDNVRVENDDGRLAVYINDEDVMSTSRAYWMFNFLVKKNWVEKI